MKNAETLVLCRTPFQAFLLQEVLRRESVSCFDLIYLTQDDSEEDKHYFHKLLPSSQSSQYLYVEKQQYDILNHICTYKKIEYIFKRRNYRKVILASIDNLPFRKMITRNKGAELISIDDGLAHISKTSIYLNDQINFRQKIYNYFFSVSSLKEIRNYISRHYSIYPTFKNVMSNTDICYVTPFKHIGSLKAEKKTMAFFVGQPFEEALSAEAIRKLKDYIDKQKIDYYILHPREMKPLVNTIPLLDKKGLIAEEAIFYTCQNKSAIIYSWSSSVMYNISSSYAQKIMILPRDKLLEVRAARGRQAGCKVVFL